MKISIERVEEDIFTNKDYSSIQSTGEIAHFLAELEIIKQELLEVWQEWQK